MTAAAVLGLGTAAIGYLMVGSQRSEVHTERVTGQVTAVQIGNPSGGVEVVGTDAPQVTVRETYHYGLGPAPATARDLESGTLRLSYGCGQGRLPFGGCNVDYRVEVPRNLNLKINAGSGDVTVRNLNGTLELEAGSGDVDVSNAGGRMRLKAGSGDIEVDGARGDLTLHAGSGNIEAGGLAGKNVVADSGSGDLKLVFTGPPGSLTAKAGSGDAKVGLPAGRYNVTAHSGSGDERVEVAADPAAPNTVDVQASSGDVEVSTD